MADKGNSVSSAVDRLLEPQSDQTKDYNISMGCFSAKHAALRRKNRIMCLWVGRHIYPWTVFQVSYNYKNPNIAENLPSWT